MSNTILSAHRRDKPSWLLSHQRFAKTTAPTPERPMYLSASEISSFLRCRVQHEAAYQLQLESRKPSIPRSMGTLGHAILEAWYTLPHARRTPAAMARIAKEHIKTTKMKELTGEDRTLLEAMVNGYVAFVTDPAEQYNDKAIGLKDCFPEEFFDQPLVRDGSIRVRGKMDLRFLSTVKKKTMGLLESKFKGKIEESEDGRVQDNTYLWAMRDKFPGFKQYTIYYQILRKQLPTSRVRSALFSREPIERTDEELEQWTTDMINIARDMLDAAVYPTRNRNCKWDCDFNVPCLLRGTPELKSVLKSEFKTRS